MGDDMDAIVSCAWLDAHLDDPTLRIVDCSVRFEPPAGAQSGRADWEAAHLPGAVFIDHFELADPATTVTMPSADVLAQALGARGIGDDTATVIYDRTDGMWAARLWWMLRAIGYDAAAVLDGGFHAWRAAGYEVTSTEQLHPPAVLTARARPDCFVDARTVLEAIASDDVAIVSALDDDLHRRGVYGRPGRIPTSRCVPYYSLLDARTSRLIDVDGIRDAFSPELSKPRVITYCGAGIAASLAALALHVAGHDNVSVYDGSLIEWCADPSLPLDPA